MAKTNPIPASSATAAAAPAEVEVTIARGVYVTADGEFGPGATVTVDADEAERLVRIGTVKAPDAIEPAEVQDGKVKIAAESGPTISAA